MNGIFFTKLELIVGVLFLFIGVFLGIKWEKRKNKIECDINTQINNTRLVNRQYLYDVCYLWMMVLRKQINLKDFFIRNNLNRVAIYGMGRLGVLLKEIINSDEVKVVYGIDRDYARKKCDIPILSPTENNPAVECVVVMVHDYDDVVATLKLNEGCRLLRFKDILELLLQESEL